MLTHLDDLFAGEHTPGDGVGTFRMGVGAEVTLLVDGVVGDARVTFDTLDELVEESGRDKELEVGLDISYVLAEESVTFW